MEKIVVNKEFLKEFDSILIALENCDVYKVGIENILDVYCELAPIGKNGSNYRTEDGFIKISQKASQTAEENTISDNMIGTDWDQRLLDRLKMCDGVDMISFSLRRKGKRDIDIYVPYDPLENILYGTEIELSNCPSLEIDNEGNMIIAFGKRSKQPRRKDNNYSELVAGWEDAFGEYKPKILRVKADKLEGFYGDSDMIIFSFKIRDKSCKKEYAELLFKGCDSVSVETYFPQKGNCDIVMSKMANGRIYVGFDGLGIDFRCASVVEYEYYCNQNGD